MPDFSKMTGGEIEGYLANRAAVLFATPEEQLGAPLNVGVGARGNRTANHFAALLKAEGRDAYDAAMRDEAEARAGR